MKVVIEFHGDVDPSTLLDAGIEWGEEFSEDNALRFDPNAVQVLEEE